MDTHDDQADGIEPGDDGLDVGATSDAVPPTLTVAFARGVNPGKWARIWSERRPDDELRLIRVDLEEQRTVLLSGEADVVLARVPIDQDGLNAIALFEELPVAVFAKGATLGADDTIGMAALVDEQLIMRPLVLEWDDHAAASGFADPAVPLTDDPEAAIELAASEVGIVVVPQSVARLHQRKDVEYRPIHDLPPVPVLLVWPQGEEDEAVEEFIGIVRGRTANSSRRVAPVQEASAPAPQENRKRRKAPQAGSSQGTAAGTSRGAQLAARKAKQEALARERRKKRKGR